MLLPGFINSKAYKLCEFGKVYYLLRSRQLIFFYFLFFIVVLLRFMDNGLTVMSSRYLYIQMLYPTFSTYDELYIHTV